MDPWLVGSLFRFCLPKIAAPAAVKAVCAAFNLGPMENKLVQYMSLLIF